MPVSETPARIRRLATWEAPVSEARFVNDARAEACERLGIRTIRDLLEHLPFRYIDLSAVVSLGSVGLGRDVTVIGRVHDIKIKKPRPRLSIVEVAIVDGTGVLMGVWFNQPFMASRFVLGERVAFAGTVQIDYGLRQIRNPFVEKLGAEEEPGTTARIVPVHTTTEGLSTNWLRRIIGSAVDDYADVPDFLPGELRSRRELPPLAASIRSAHFPEDELRGRAARRRFAYAEFLTLQIGMLLRRHHITDDRTGVRHSIDGHALRALAGVLPFELTGDQSSAVREILAEMSESRVMNRMLLGDVGTGKTAVAAHALCAAADSGHQAAMMAPTEVLARQYADKVGPWLDGAGVSWALLTGATPAAARKGILADLAAGTLKVLFGTHALLESKVGFGDLSLAIVDEQHRFGVNQRLGLRSKGTAPDMLVMTATPIPRSLALTLYGDLAVSYVRSRPESMGARSVTSEIAPRSQRNAAYDRVRTAVADGRQAYVICPLVDESDSVQAASALKEAERLSSKVFPDLKVGVLTGRMSSTDKIRIMQQFRGREIDVLVSTTVVEVGVDVPNATVMIVEGAERFGLSQLHQLRGRIGRGEHPGAFLLFSEARSPEGKARMEAIVSTDDGFVLAEEDLRLRGQGQLFGERQHGLPELKFASLLGDAELLELAREDAAAIVAADPHLEFPVHAPLLLEVKHRFGAAWEWVSSG